MTTLLFCLLLAEPTKVVYAAGYIPNIQFAPFYVADIRGYYREEGLAIEMDYTMGPDVMKLVALGKVQFASADPDGFLHAVVRGLPVVHVATLYQRYPVALIAKAPILDGPSLKGKRIGVSGTYGSSYLGLKAMLTEMDLALEDITLASIGFTQVSALQNGQVDAVVGYVNNEPIHLQALGETVHTRTLGQAYAFPGVGLMTSQAYRESQSEQVQKFLRATFRGMMDVLADPQGCFDLVVREKLLELQNEKNAQSAFLILQATLPYWQSKQVEAEGLGQCDPQLWEQLAQNLAETSGNRSYLEWPKWVNREFRWNPAKH